MAQHNADMAELSRLNDALYSKKLQSIGQLRDGYTNAPAQAAPAEHNPKAAGKQSYQVRALGGRRRGVRTIVREATSSAGPGLEAVVIREVTHAPVLCCAVYAYCVCPWGGG